MSEAKTIDAAALARLLQSINGDRAFMVELIDTYLADAPGLLAAMRQSLQAGDTAGLRRAAHSLKSNSTNFGATDLARMCRELEEMAQAGRLDGAAERLAQAEIEYQRVEEELSSARQEFLGS